MPTKTRSTERRDDALSRDRIVDTAIETLDAAGESGLTFRTLSTQLKTGPGAIYWHVANKDELLIAATDAVLTRTTAPAAPDDTPQDAIRTVALGVFDAIDAHPWVGSELSRAPAPPAILRIFECIGQQVQALGVPVASQFATASALLNYILGVGGRNAAQARAVQPGTNRAEFFTAVAAEWANLDPDGYPFMRAIGGQMRDHDDRVQFLHGVDLILAGVSSLQRSADDLPHCHPA